MEQRFILDSNGLLAAHKEFGENKSRACRLGQLLSRINHPKVSTRVHGLGTQIPSGRLVPRDGIQLTSDSRPNVRTNCPRTRRRTADENEERPRMAIGLAR